MNQKQKKVFGIIANNIKWYDIKTKIKQIIRSIGYSKLMQELICLLITSYMKLVYYTSRKVFINKHVFLDMIKQNRPVIIALWHSRLIMAPFMVYQAKKVNKSYNFFALVSRHGDGKIVSTVMSKFGVANVSGSSIRGRSGRGINLSNFRKIFHILKTNNSFVITPDGPRGPKQQINGQLINIAKISKVPIMPFSYSSSRYIKLKTWDGFIIPLPFSKICYHFGDLIYVKKNIKDKEIKKLNKFLAEKINLSLQKAEKAVIPNPIYNSI